MIKGFIYFPRSTKIKYCKLFINVYIEIDEFWNPSAVIQTMFGLEAIISFSSQRDQSK